MNNNLAEMISMFDGVFMAMLTDLPHISCGITETAQVWTIFGGKRETFCKPKNSNKNIFIVKFPHICPWVCDFSGGTHLSVWNAEMARAQCIDRKSSRDAVSQMKCTLRNAGIGDGVVKLN